MHTALETFAPELENFAVSMLRMFGLEAAGAGADLAAAGLETEAEVDDVDDMASTTRWSWQQGRETLICRCR